LEQPLSTTSSSAIREGLTHPVIDSDGHNAEYFPALIPYLREEGFDIESPSMRSLLPPSLGPPMDWHALTPEERARRRTARPPWWSSPAENTLDMATSLFPGLLYERLDDFGIDVSVVYPSVGMVFLHLLDERERRSSCRALNRYNADGFRPFADRLVPVAAIPMVTPDEAVDELEHAVTHLGYKAVLLAGYVQRPIAAAVDDHPDLAPWALWLDQFGIDSAYNYDPVWAKCQELGVSVAFHSGFIGVSSRRSISSYVHNHLGSLAEGQHAVAKSLFLGGVTRRFPELNFAFLEGGVAWAATLYADLIGHWEKRNRQALNRLDPSRVDARLLSDLAAKYRGAWPTVLDGLAMRRPVEDPAMLDEWAACGIERAEDIRDLFVNRFYFGCEADDPMNTTAFNTRVNPFGARLNALFGSDISHWDVPDMTETVEEAWEMVEHGLFTSEDFRDFTFGNPVRFFTGGDPGFFKGTVVEAAVDDYLASARPSMSAAGE
jgi:predicted TIM-barrel fold metal-dependent hydrolase